LTPDPQAVHVFVPNWLGDAVMALPAVADLRRHFNRAQLVIAARPSVASLFALVPGIDRVATLRWRGRWPGQALQGDLDTLRHGCDPSRSLAVLLPNSFAAAWMAKRAGITDRWGYATDWRAPLLTRAIRVPRTSVHQGRYYQQLTGMLGIAGGPLEPTIDVPAAMQEEARRLLRQAGWDGRQRLVVMAPGAAYGTAKRWLPAHFATLIGSLAHEQGARTVLVGSAGDAETVQMILRHPTARDAAPIDIVNRTSLQQLAGVIAVSSAGVANDSGAMHLAGAIGTPIVALFGPTRDTETSPLTRAGAQSEVLINPVWCRPCMLRECPIDHRCMKGLLPAVALRAVVRALSAPRGRCDHAGRGLAASVDDGARAVPGTPDQAGPTRGAAE
jgi:heptosyltransferase-2